jgi:hypothetical protein
MYSCANVCDQKFFTDYSNAFEKLRKKTNNNIILFLIYNKRDNDISTTYNIYYCVKIYLSRAGTGNFASNYNNTPNTLYYNNPLH